MITKENKAITLIALVVTIILLLILAGVSITTLTGENGIFNRAIEAKEEKEKSQKNEDAILEYYEKEINRYMLELPSTEYTIPYLPDATKFEKVSGTDLNSGLVIKEKTTESEYVWVEVPRTIEVYPTAGIDIINFNDEEDIKIENDLHTYTSEYRNGTDYSDTYAKDETTGWFDNEEQYNELKNKMLKSVYENGGFWVGRYEAGVEENRTDSGETTAIPLTKDNLYPYTYVTRTQAKVLAEKVESGIYTSSLLFGIQWDLALKFIETKFIDQNSNSDIKMKLKSNSTEIGNYYNSEFTLSKGKFAKYNSLLNWYTYDSKEMLNLVEEGKKNGQTSPLNGVLLTTGATEVSSLQNIYDMAGNVWEWTLEKSSEGNAYRGGNCHRAGSDAPASKRGNNNNIHNDNDLGFRVSIF